MPEPEPAPPSVLTLGGGMAPAQPGGEELPSAPPGAAEVHYHLPVEIEVRAAPAAAVDADAVAEKALLGLVRGLANT